MNLQEFARGISFAEIQPETDLDACREWTELSDLERLRREVHNTILPSDQDRLRTVLAPVLRMPRMSTFAVAALINHAVATMPEGHAYVNVGVWNGFTLLSGMAGHMGRLCAGVDNFSTFGGPRDNFYKRFQAQRGHGHSFFDGDYQAYFKNVHQAPIGLYLYDGDHTAEHQYEGLRVAEPFFAPECYILVDDTNWVSPRRGTLAFMSASKRQYDVVFDCKTAHNKHPTFWNGLMLLHSTVR